MSQCILWDEWSQAFSALRPAFSRQVTFFWACILCAGIAVRTNLRGISSIVDCLGLQPNAYGSLIHLFQSYAIKLNLLLECWVNLCLKLFVPLYIEGNLVLLGDGIKIPKEGYKMPAVKLMHQSSQSNSKPKFIAGHYFQTLSLAISTPEGKVEAVPLMARIHDGIVQSNRSKKTSLNMFGDIIQEVVCAAGFPAIVVADAYYANSSVINEVEKLKCQLVSRVAHNTVAYHPAAQPQKRKRGRPAIKGERVELKQLASNLEHKFEDYRYTYLNLYWPPAKRILRFVVVKHETKGSIILMSTKTDLNPETIIKLYAKRWLIETDYKTAVHEIGTFSYRYWMKSMKPNKKKAKQYLHRESQEYRKSVLKKVEAYHIHAMFGCIVQGLMKHLAINHSAEVWKSFKGWLRTIRDDVKPSETVVADALRSTLWNYLRASKGQPGWVKFMLERIDPGREKLIA